MFEKKQETQEPFKPILQPTSSHQTTSQNGQERHEKEDQEVHLQCLLHVRAAAIQEFKEPFQMIDADRNGIITVGDLKATYASLGVRNVDQDELEKMTAEAG